MRLVIGVLIVAAVVLLLVGARYTIEASGPGGIWQLDRLTGAVRICVPHECRQWIAP